MNTNFQNYQLFLGSVSEKQHLALNAEIDIYPKFVEIKKIVQYYYSTINKFTKIQNELIDYLESFEINDDDNKYYKTALEHLNKIDIELSNLKNKKVSSNVKKSINNFIIYTYNNSSIYDLNSVYEGIDENRNVIYYEINRTKKNNSIYKSLILTGCILVLIYLLFKFLNK
jgi:hypothetical protein